MLLPQNHKTPMPSIAGLCISRSGIDIAVVSTQDGTLQESSTTPLQQIDPIDLNADVIIAPFKSLASQHPAELSVLTISTQVIAGNKYNLLPKIGLTTDDRLTIDYIEAYVAGRLKADEIASAPCILFIEITPTIFVAQIVTIHLNGTKRIRAPVFVEAITSTTTLPTFLGQVFAWAQSHNHKLFQCVLFDPPSGSVDNTALQSALSPDCPIVIVDGAQLAKYAASYAFLNIEELRQPDDGDDMGQYVAPNPISFLVNNGPPTVIIHRSEPLPAHRDILYTIPEENQTSTTTTVEFAYGKHDSRPDDRFIFAKVTLEGLVRPNPVGERQITISMFVSEGWGNSVEVFHGSERKKSDVRADVRIPDPFSGPAYDAVHSILS